MLGICQVPELSGRIFSCFGTDPANHTPRTFCFALLLSWLFLPSVVFVSVIPDVQGAEGNFVQDPLGQCTSQKTSQSLLHLTTLSFGAGEVFLELLEVENRQ